MLVPKLGDPVSTEGLRDEETELGEQVDISAVFTNQEDPTLGDPITLTSPSDSLGEGVSLREAFDLDIPREEESFGRLRSGINAVGRRTSQALFRDLPQGVSLILHKTNEQSREGQALAAAAVEKRKRLEGNPDLLPGDLELTPEERAAVLENTRQFSFQDLEEDPIYQFGRRMGDAAAEVFPSNPEFQGELFADIVPSAIGDILSILVSRGAGRISAGATASAQIAAPEFQRAMEAGATEDEAFQQYLLALPLGAVEKVPVMNLLKRTDDVTGGGIKRWLAKTAIGGIEEGIQEAFENTYLNIAAKNTYDETQDIWEGLGESTKGGLGAGLVLNGFAAAFGGRRRGNRNPETGEVIDPALDGDIATATQDIESQLENDPAILAEGLVDWEVYKTRASDNTFETEPGELKPPEINFSSDIDPTSGKSNPDIPGVTFVTEEELREKERINEARISELRIQADDAVSENVVGFVTDVTDQLGIKTPIRIVSRKAARNRLGVLESEVDSAILDGFLLHSKSKGAYKFDSDGGFHVLMLDESLSSIEIAETVSHELGHLVMDELFQSSVHVEAINELRSIHSVAIEELKSQSTETVLKNYRTPINSLSLLKSALKTAAIQGHDLDTFRDRSFSEFSQDYPRFTEYLTSFDEWFADQFSKWVATAPNRRDISSPIGKFYRALLDRLHQVYSYFKESKTLRPDARFEDWIERFVVPRIEPDETVETSRQYNSDPGLKLMSDLAPRIPEPTPPINPDPQDPDTERSFNLNPDDIRFGERLNQDTGLTQPNMATRAWQQFIKWLAPRGRLDQQSFNTIQRALAGARSEVREAFGRVRQVQDVLARDYPDGTMPPEVERQMDQVMRGRRSDIISFVQDPTGSALGTRVISDDLLLNLLQARRHIDRLSTTLITSGIIEGPLAIRVASNIGSYLHRSYRVHTEPDWAERVPPDVMTRARAFIRDRFIDENGFPPSPREMQNIIDTLLTNSEVQQKLLTNQRLNQAGLDILIQRNQVPPPIRALWGEIESPVYNYFESVRKIAQLISSNQAVSQIRDEGSGTYFFEEDNMFHSPGYIELIQAGVDDPLRPLAGWKTHPDILQSLRQAFGERDMPSSVWQQWLLKTNGMIKLGKTVLNPLTVSRNFYGGTMFMLANGHGPQNLVRFGRAVTRTLLDRGVNQRKNRYTELGLLDQSLIQGETIDAVRDLGIEFDERDFLGNLDPFRNRSLARRLLSGSVGRATQFYNGIDSMIRITMFEAELNSQINDLFPNSNPTAAQRQALEEQVAVQIRDTYQNYSQVPLAIRRLRSNLLVGPFVSFPYEAIRTSINTMSYARQEMQSDNPRVRSRGYRRAFSLLATMSLGTTATLSSMALLGIDEETEDDITKLAAPWDRNIGKAYTRIGKGVVEYVNLGYTFPFTIMERPLLTMFMRGDEGFFDAAGTAMLQFFGEFLGLEIGTQKVLEFYKNENSFGGQIYNPSASLGQKFADGFVHFSDAFTPGVIDLTVVRPIQEGADFDPVTEAWQIATGVKRVELDVNRSFMFKSRDFDQERRNIRRLANGVLFDPDATVEEKRAAVAESQRLYEIQWKEMQSLYDSAFRLGVDPADLEASLESARLGKKIRQDLLNGVFTPLEFDNVP